MFFGKQCYDRLVMSAIGRGVEGCGEIAEYLPFLDTHIVFSIIGVLGKGEHQGEGAAHLSAMCLTPCHRGTPRQSFNSRKLPRQT